MSPTTPSTSGCRCSPRSPTTRPIAEPPASDPGRSGSALRRLLHQQDDSPGEAFERCTRHRAGDRPPDAVHRLDIHRPGPGTGLKAVLHKLPDRRTGQPELECEVTLLVDLVRTQAPELLRTPVPTPDPQF